MKRTPGGWNIFTPSGKELYEMALQRGKNARKGLFVEVKSLKNLFYYQQEVITRWIPNASAEAVRTPSNRINPNSNSNSEWFCFIHVHTSFFARCGFLLSEIKLMDPMSILFAIRVICMNTHKHCKYDHVKLRFYSISLKFQSRIQQLFWVIWQWFKTVNPFIFSAFDNFWNTEEWAAHMISFEKYTISHCCMWIRPVSSCGCSIFSCRNTVDRLSIFFSKFDRQNNQYKCFKWLIF